MIKEGYGRLAEVVEMQEEQSHSASIEGITETHSLNSNCFFLSKAIAAPSFLQRNYCTAFC